MQRLRRLLLAAATLLVLLSGSYRGASAITNGQPDGNRHPYVALIAFYDADRNPLRSCSGVKIAPDLLLTAGHCTDGALSARAYFSPDLKTQAPIVAMGTPVTPDALYQPAAGLGLGRADGYDIGVVKIADPSAEDFASLPNASLPDEDLVEELPAMAQVDLVGYGAQGWDGRVPNPADPPHTIRKWTYNFQRLHAPAKLVNDANLISGEFARITANPAQDKGGACFGDSGGPVLLRDTDTVLAVVSFAANPNCAGVTYVARVDTAAALEFIKNPQPN